MFWGQAEGSRPLPGRCAAIIVVTIGGVAVGRYPMLHMNRATIALTGATILLFRPSIPHFPNPTQAWLTLAMATTLAGNLTLLGSVANLIVAETARRRGVTLSFTEYLKAGPLITAASLLLGIVWLSQV